MDQSLLINLGETLHADDRDRIIDFRNKLKDENLVDFFSTQDNLCQKLVIGLESYRAHYASR